MNTTGSPLEEALSALKPNAIYTMAPAKEIATAASYFAQGAVETFRLGQSGMLLEAVLAGEDPPAVRFTCEGGTLQGVCDCGIGYGGRCRHVIASVMTIARVLHGSRFHRNDLPADHVERLRSKLKAPEPEPLRPKVIFEENDCPGRFAIDYDTGRREASWVTTGAPSGMKWLEWQHRQPELVAESFCEWLSEMPGTTEIIFRTGDGEYVFSGLQWERMRAQTRFRGKENSILINRALQREGGELVETFLDIGYGLALLPEKFLIAWIHPSDAWQGLYPARRGQTAEAEQVLDVTDFNVSGAKAPRENHTLLGCDGRPVKPTEVTCRGAIRVATHGEVVRVCVRTIADDGHEIAVHGRLAEYFQSMFDDRGFPLLLKSPSRRRKLAECLAGLVPISDDAEIEAFLEVVSRDGAFISYQMHGEDAMKCLRKLLGKLREMDARWLIAEPLQMGNPWLLLEGAGAGIGRALAALINGLPAADPLHSRDLAIEMDGAQFFQSLPSLMESCERFGIELRMDEGAVKVESLELSVRAVRSDEIDWFELHPEARAGSLSIPQEKWKEILRSRCYRTGEDTLVAFDDRSLSALRQMLSLLGSTGEERLRMPRLGLFDWLALRAEGVQCELPPEEETVLHSLRQLEEIPGRPIPGNLQAELRDYQRHGYEWLAFLYSHRFGACLADDMGLGKTLQAITLLAALKEGVLSRQSAAAHEPHLIVLPPTLVFNWRSEIERFAPDLRVREYAGQGRSADFSQADVVLTTYELARRDIEILACVQFDVVIFDEAQAIKNAAAARTQAMARLKARFRLCLTGTPLENHIGEFHSIMEAAVPGLFGERRQFLRQYEGGDPGLLARTRPFLLRRTKDKILSELPALMESDMYFALSERQRECYTRAVGEVREEVLAAFNERPAQQAGIIALAALLRLRQICIAPAMISDDLDADSPKLEYLAGQLEELAEEGHAALVFSSFVKALDLTADRLEASGLPFLRMDGSTPTRHRKELVEGFQSGRSPGIFLISLKTGGSGLNLTRASYVYHLDPWWNPAVENQAGARAHRIGQKNSVFVQRLLMSHTVEEKMMALKQRKQVLFDSVVRQGESLMAKGGVSLAADDFRFLIDQ